jgi:hypothetical protein
VKHTYFLEAMLAGTLTHMYLLLAASPVMRGDALEETPIQKVVILLKDIASKVAAEGQKEAAEYDKFACFCKEQADEKQYAMEKSAARIEDLSAEIEMLTTKKSKLNREIRELKEQSDKLEERVYQRERRRRTTHERYLSTGKDMNEAIDACERAIETIKNSKTEMRGAKLDLIQVTSGLMKAVKKQAQLANTHGVTTLLSKIGDQAAPKFEYQSNDILATLEDLLASFKSMKTKLDEDEHNGKAADELSILAMNNQIDFKEKAIREKAAIMSATEEQEFDRRGQLNDEANDKKADKEFTKRLKPECEKRAFLFDQRSSMRAKELRALDEATQELERGAVPNYSANKKLVGLQESAVGKAGKIEKGLTFVQISETVKRERSRDEAGLDRVRSFLAEAAQRTGSSALASAAVRIGVAANRQRVPRGVSARMQDPDAPAPDHFKLVRSIIENLIARLQDDATSEAKQRTNCDDGITSETGKRDSANAKIEMSTAELTVLASNKNKLEEGNQQLTAQIAELKKAQLEVQELYAEQYKDLKEQEEMQREGIYAVKDALEVLEMFYGKTAHGMDSFGKIVDHDTAYGKPRQSFLQFQRTAGRRYRPRDEKGFIADRDGNTVGDLAPTTFGDTYHGAQEESEGIIGILEVILEDFNKGRYETDEDLHSAEEMKDEFLKQTGEDVTAKQTLIDKNKASITEINENLVEQEQANRDAKGELESAEKALSGWHTMCVEGEETWKERAQKREEEVEALKSALEILEEWKN